MRTLSVLVLALAFNVARGEDDKVKKEMALLEGEWSMVSGTAAGNDMPAEMLKSAKRTTKDGVTTIEIDGNIYMKAKFTIDPSKKVKAIDYEVTEGPSKDKKVLGIYKIDDGKITFCFGQPGEDRHTKFESTQENKQVLSVWKKAEKN